MNELIEAYSLNETLINELENHISEAVAEMQFKQNSLIETNKIIREKIKEQMEIQGIKKFKNEFIDITYVAPTTRKTVDSKKLKEKFEDIYNQCLKTTEVKSSIRIKLQQNLDSQKQIESFDASILD